MGLGLILQGFLGVWQEGALAFSLSGIFKVVLAILFLIAYTILFPLFGFVITSTLFFISYAYLFGLHNIIKLVSGGIIASVTVWLFFEKLFNIPLPHGILF